MLIHSPRTPPPSFGQREIHVPMCYSRKCGWLKVFEGKKSKERWCVLDESALALYDSRRSADDPAKALRVVQWSDIVAVSLAVSTHCGLDLQLRGGKLLPLRAETPDAQRDWCHAILCLVGSRAVLALQRSSDASPEYEEVQVVAQPVGGGRVEGAGEW